MPQADLSVINEKYESAVEIADVRQEEAIHLLKKLIETEVLKNDEAVSKVKEQAIYRLGEIYAKTQRGVELASLLKEIRPFFAEIPKAKTAKIVRTLIELVAKIPDSIKLQIELCTESIEWAKVEKRTFLRQRIETKLIQLLIESEKFNEAINIINPLLREVKRIEDKQLLVELHLLESIVYHKLRNIPKSRGAWTACRTAANSTYVPPTLQAQIDMQSGILNADETDFRTAYSYFFEAFEAYHSVSDTDAISALKYMLLSKIMINKSDEVHTILTGKLTLQYAGRDLEALKAVANSHKARSLSQFENVLSEYKHELKDDPFIKSHLSDLYEEMLSQNLIKIVEPYECVEIDYISKLINIERKVIEKKLSQMILDKHLNGIIDQGNGCLMVFQKQEPNGTFEAVLETIQNMSKVVDTLFDRATELN